VSAQTIDAIKNGKTWTSVRALDPLAALGVAGRPEIEAGS
jgi:hypothetical protein